MPQLLRDIEPLRPLLAQHPLALLSDIDGTLSPIVPNPDDARVSERNDTTLRALIARGVKVGLITGRDLDRARRLIDLPGAVYAASHGLTIFDGGRVEAPVDVAEWVTRAREIVRGASDLEANGVTIEDKGAIVAFHYRRAPSESAAVAAIRHALSLPVANGFRVMEGRKVIELRPPVNADKGSAVIDLVQRMSARSVICLGDDVTDIDMFEAVHRLRSDGARSAVVGVNSPEASENLLAACDYLVEGVEGVEWLLEEVLNALPATKP